MDAVVAGGGMGADWTVPPLEKKESSPDGFFTSVSEANAGAGSASVSKIPQPSATGLTRFFTDSSHDVEPRMAWNLARGLDCATAECLVNFNAAMDAL